MMQERYRNLEIELQAPVVTGSLGRETTCSAIVYKESEFLFAVTVGVSYALSAREQQEAGSLAAEYAHRHAHGLIDLQRYEDGQEYEVLRTESWVEDAASGEVSEEAIRHELLGVAERMARSEAGTSEIPWLDVAGVADVLQVDLQLLEAELVMMEIEGLITPHVPTLGRGLEKGALRITPAGIALLRSLWNGERRTASESAHDAASEESGMANSEAEYDVALSFAGEQRPYVERVAEVLSANGIRVFYDAYETVGLWGKDLYEHLDEVYRKQSRFVMIFVSAEYAEKAWPTHERKSAQARALEESEEYILPVRFDDTELPGLRPTVGYIDARTTGSDETARLLLEKLEQIGETASAQSPAVIASSAWHVDLALLWDDNGSSRYAARWQPGVGFSAILGDDEALEGMNTDPVPPELPLDDAIAVAHLRGRHLKFVFSSPARPITARLHHGDSVHEPTGKGGGGDMFLEFNLQRWPELG